MLLTVDTPGERIDVFLSKKYSEYSRGYFQRLIKEGNIRVNKKETASSYHVKLNDKIQVNFVKESKELIAEEMPLDIIYEDDDIILVNKAPGLVVHPACGHQSGTLLNALAGYAKNTFNPMLVHRLDKDTSGIMIIAKNERSKNSLVKQFQNRTIKKTYYVMVSGDIKHKKGRIEAPLGRSPLDRKKIIVGPLATKPAVTEYKVLKRFKKYSLLEAYPLTGRTHQIRSHFIYIGHPVLGDSFYGGPGKIDDKVFPRQMLHAYSIQFSHPSKSKNVEFKAELPDDMAELWKGGL